jgi:hypothetical protein
MNISMAMRWCLGALMLGLCAAPTLAQEAAQCSDEVDELRGARLVRRTSLDLRNVIPTPEEMRSHQTPDGQVDPAQLERYLASDGFLEVMRNHHADLLWPNLNLAQVIENPFFIIPFFDPQDPRPVNERQPLFWWAPIRSVYTRTVGGYDLYQPCLDQPAQFDAEGRLILEPVTQGGEIVAYAEGWVEVTPYWDPSTTIRVCGLDAQPDSSSTVCPGPAGRFPFADPQCNGIAAADTFVEQPFRGSVVACNSPFAFLAPGCGCGPDLAYCATPDTVTTIRSSMIEQQMRLLDDVVRSGAPYEELLTRKTVEWNGPLVHYMTNQAPASFSLYTGEPDAWSLPDLAYTDPQWQSRPRSARHAGVLTTPGYLLRFAADRMRAHRYYNAFECRSFVPAGPLPSPFEECSQRDDLTERCGCDTCHITLEPLAAHWGRFAANGFGELDSRTFPTQLGGDCLPPIATAAEFFRCVTEYNVQPVGEEEAYRNYLSAYVYRDPSEYAMIEQGPSLRVQQGVESGVIQSCLAERLWMEFMRREPTAQEVADVIPELVAAFEAGGRDVKALVRAIVELPAYRRTE